MELEKLKRCGTATFLTGASTMLVEIISFSSSVSISRHG